MEVFRKKYNSVEKVVIFVMASDDEEWCRKMFSNETVASITFQLKCVVFVWDVCFGCWDDQKYNGGPTPSLRDSITDKANFT